MRITSSIAMVLLLLGCTSAPRPQSVSVGMLADRAESILKSAGAKQVQMDMVDKTETDIIKSYNLANGTLLVVTISKSENKISKLEVCSNPDQPKVKRTWASVRSLTLTD